MKPGGVGTVKVAGPLVTMTGRANSLSVYVIDDVDVGVAYSVEVVLNVSVF